MSFEESPLILQKLTKHYGSFVALNQLNFSLKPGEIFGLLGPNGAGKTTTLSIISGLEKPTSGTAIIFGYPILESPILVKRCIGVVPQEITSNGFFTVNEVLHHLSGFFSISNNEDWIELLLKKLDLYRHKDKTCSQLSGGMKRRLMIAKALVHKPKLLFLDEPTAGVDVELRETLWDFILELNQKGMTILLTTHYLEEAEHLCDRIGVIGSGKLLRLDQTKTLIDQLTHRKIVISLKKPMPSIHSPYLLSQKDQTITFQTPRGTDFSVLLQESGMEMGNIRDVAVSEGTLEEAFRNILGGVS